VVTKQTVKQKTVKQEAVEDEIEIITPPPEKPNPTVVQTVQTYDAPTTVATDGFDDTDGGDQRLIHGTILKCVDGDWSDREGTRYPLGTEMLALNTAEALQCWREQRVVDIKVKVPGKPLPDIDELNAAIPQKTWEKGLDNKPRPPWQHVFIVYLLRPTDANVFTLINSTAGMRRCYERIKDKVRWMRTLLGSKVFPLVKLDNRPMPTQFGMKKRPELTVSEWRDLSGAPAIEQTQKQIGQAVREVSSAEAMNDEIGF
jgi:hypothetical protein